MNIINNLKCEYCQEPLGIDNPFPYFSWTIDGNDKSVFQKSYRIIVKCNEFIVWDTDFINSSETFNIEYSGLELENLKKYDWKVFVTTTDGILMESDDTFFVTGLIDLTQLKGKWIEHPASHDNPLFYGDFFVKKGLVSACFLISGLGYYEFSINGKRGHDTYNVPGWTDYKARDLSGLLYPYNDESEKRVLYNVYDIKNLLKNGLNRYEIMLGNGFFNQSERLIEGDMSYGTPRLLFEFHMLYEDRSKVVITSDETIFCTDGPIEFNNIFFGEVRNDNVGLDYSGDTTAVESKWEPGNFIAQYDYYDKITEVITPHIISNNIYDAGKNLSGRVRINASAPRGAELKIIYFDAIDENGKPDFHPAGGEWQIQENKYIFGENKVVDYKETFGWRGFRYFIIEKDNDVDIKSISVESIHTYCGEISKFKSDNKILNWIHQAYVNSQTSNMHGGVPSDCPHRERLGYTGDGQITAESALKVLGNINFLRKWNDDIIASQNKSTGFVPHTVPFSGGGGGPAWGSACAIVPAKVYDSTFDIRIIHKSYNTIQNWIKYLENKNPELIIKREEEGSWCLGEWCIPVDGYEVEQVNLDRIFAELSPAFVNTAYFFECVRICVDFGKKLSRDTTYYERLAERIKRKFNEVFLNKKTWLYDTGKHYSNVYALFFNMVNASELKEVQEALVKQIEMSNYSMDMGIFAVSMIPKVLLEAKREDILDRILMNREYPSYGFMMDSGSVNLWETWDGRASLNHPMFGGIVSFLYRYIAGIRYIGKDQKILIEPVFLNSLKKADVVQNSIYGKISIKWKKLINNDSAYVKIKIGLPGNTRGVLKYKDEIELVNNGVSHYQINLHSPKITRGEE